MSECWSEGELRAYLDRELPAADMEKVARHLEVCSECGDLWSELAGRAARVSELMGALPDLSEAGRVRRMPVRRTGMRRLAWAAGALAAGVALGVAMMPKHQEPHASVTPVAIPAVPEQDPIAVPVVPNVVTEAASAPSPVHVRRMRPAMTNVVAKASSDDEFLALDDEPIETGVVMRMVLGPKEVPADVLFGADGRHHAIRLVNSK